MFDSFNGWKFASVDPAHKLPRSLTFVGYFLNFEVEKCPFGGFDCFLKGFPVFKFS